MLKVKDEQRMVAQAMTYMGTSRKKGLVGNGCGGFSFGHEDFEIPQCRCTAVEYKRGTVRKSLD